MIDLITFVVRKYPNIQISNKIFYLFYKLIRSINNSSEIKKDDLDIGYRIFLRVHHIFVMHNVKAENMKTAQELYVKMRKLQSDMRAEQVRASMNPADIVNALNSISEQALTCNLDDLPRLQLMSNIQFGLLKKCLPDLRSLEVKEKTTNARRLIIDLPKKDSSGEEVS